MRPAADSLAAPRVRRTLLHDARANWQLHLLLLLPLIYLLIFKYVPMWGAQIAFRDFFAVKGIFGSPWVGMANFDRFFESPQFWTVLRNTLGLSAYQIAASFPIPIILALALNNVEHRRFRKTVQLTTYAPHFISTVVMAGMIMRFLALHTGVVNSALEGLGLERISFMSSPGAVSIGVRGFRHLAERRLGHHHLLGGARRRRPAAARGGDRGRRLQAAAHPPHRRTGHRAGGDHPADPGDRAHHAARVREGVPAADPPSTSSPPR